MNNTYKRKKDVTDSTSRGWKKAMRKAGKAKDRRFNKKLVKEEIKN